MVLDLRVRRFLLDNRRDAMRNEITGAVALNRVAAPFLYVLRSQHDIFNYKQHCQYVHERANVFLGPIACSRIDYHIGDDA